jgi:WD40 repeat protein
MKPMRTLACIVIVLCWFAGKSQTPELVIQQPHTEEILVRKMNPNGNFIATGSRDKTIKIWDIKTQSLYRSISGFVFYITGLEFSPDGRYLISRGDLGLFRLWDWEQGHEIRIHEMYHKPVTYMVFSKNSQFLFSGNMDGLVYITRMADLKTVQLSNPHKGEINTIVVNEEEHILSIHLKDVQGSFKIGFRSLLEQNGWLEEFNQDFTWEKVLNETAFESEFEQSLPALEIVNSLIFSHDANSVYLGTSQGKLKQWDLKFNKMEEVASFHGSINDICLDPSGSRLFLCGSGFGLKIIELSDKSIQSVDDLPSDLYACDVNAKGTLIALASAAGDILICDPEAGSILSVYSTEYQKEKPASRSVKFSPDGKYFAFAAANSVWLYDQKKGELKKRFSVSGVCDIDFSSDSKTILAFDTEKSVRIFDVKSYKTLSKMRDPFPSRTFDSQIRFFPMSRDGNRIAHAAEDWHILVRDMANPKDYKKFQGHTNMIRDIALEKNGSFMVSSSGDGTVRLWDLHSAELLLSLVQADNEFILFNKNGYYQCTREGSKLVAYRYGVSLFPFEQFDHYYNRPDLVLGSTGKAESATLEAYRKAYEKRMDMLGLHIVDMDNEFHVPVIMNQGDKIPFMTDNPEMRIQVKAADEKYNIDRINLWINDVSVYGSQGIDVSAKKGKEVSTELKFTLSPGKNKIQLSCMNTKGVESFKETFYIENVRKNVKNPDLYLIVISTSKYGSGGWDLRYAVKDGRDLIDMFHAYNSSYSQIIIDSFFNEGSKKSEIEKVKERLMQSSIEDHVVLFASGHGLLDENMDFYLASYDMDFDRPALRGIPYDLLEELLDGIPARNKVLLIDACHSGEVDITDKATDIDAQELNFSDGSKGSLKVYDFRGTRLLQQAKPQGPGLINSFELMQQLFVNLNRGSGTIVISAAAGNGFALEGDNWNNGVFTYSLISGIKTAKADRNLDSQISISELRNYVLTHVVELTSGMQKPTSRQENVSNDFFIIRLD